MSGVANTPTYNAASRYASDHGLSICGSPGISTMLNDNAASLGSETSSTTLLGFDTAYRPSPTASPSHANGSTPISNGTRHGATPASERHQSIGMKSDKASPHILQQVKEKIDTDGQAQEHTADSNSGPPPWIEMKTKAGKERKRLPLACIACRRKKIRCSGEHPACKHCVRSRIPCVYKVTTRKAAPRTDYMAMLDKRLKRMEERVIKIIPKEAQGIVAATGRATVKPAATGIAGAGVARRASMSKKRAAEQAFGDISARYGADIPALARSAANTKEPLQALGLDEQSLLREGFDKLPPKDIQEHLAEVFFDFVYGQSYHLLHKPSFMRRLAQGEIAPVLLLAVCAVAARFSEHPAVRSEPAFLRGEEWAAAAREISLRRYDSPSITIIIVYLILTLHEFGTCQGGRSWMFAGMAQRMAYAMQLHHDLAYDPQTQHTTTRKELFHTDREIRRRVMWSCFMTDRFCSSGTERPTFISVEHLKLQLPIRESYFRMELTGPTQDLAGKTPAQATPEDEQLSDAKHNMGVAAYIIRIVAVWGDCINYYNMGGKAKEQYPMWDARSRFEQLRRAIRSWHDTLPDWLQYRPENLASHISDKAANQFVYMHVIYQQTSLFIHRFALPLMTSNSALVEGIPKDFIRDAARTAVEAANNISLLIDDCMSYNVVAPFAGYSAFCSSTVHVQGAFSKNPTLVASSSKHLTRNINYLTKMKKHWGMFHFMTENLRDLYRKHVDAARHSVQSGGDKGNDQIFQFGDWFDRYPHGVSGAGYDEPQVNLEEDSGADAAQQSDLQTVEEFFSNVDASSQPTIHGQKGKKARKTESRDNTQQAQSGVDGHRSAQIQAQQVNELYTTIGSGVDTSPVYLTGFESQAYPSQIDQVYLDRQAALAAYTGFDTDSAMAFATPGAMLDPLSANIGFNPGIGSMPDIGQASYHAAASGGWYMPLDMNMNAADLADACGPVMSDSLDWSTQFDMSTMPPSVLAPLAQMDIDGSHNRNGLG